MLALLGTEHVPQILAHEVWRGCQSFHELHDELALVSKVLSAPPPYAVVPLVKNKIIKTAISSCYCRKSFSDEHKKLNRTMQCFLGMPER